MARIEIKSTWDGDTTTYRVWVDGERKGAYWNYADAKAEADKLEAELNKEDKNMKEAMVKVVDFELNGVRYTNTRPNYYYKKEDGKQVRIGKAEWDEAVAKSGLKEELEEKKTKSAKKTSRKSKDIALEVNGVTLTKKQVAFLKRLPEDDFYENGIDSALWIDVLCDTVADEFNAMSVGAMVSTLREKNVISVSKERVNGKIAKYMAFTEIGKEIAKKLGLK